MRTALVDALVALAEEDERIFLLTADLGWSVVEPFADRFPERFLNVGVAEGNMLGIASGLAIEGCVPFAYSIATFATMRGYEALRNGPVLHRLPVRLVGIGGGFAYGSAGPTHHAMEDLALMRAQPAMTVIAPADPAQTRAAVRASLAVDGPVYLRVGKGGNPAVPGLDGRFALGRPEVVRRGSDVLLVTCGAITPEVLAAAEELEDEGVSAGVAVLAHLGSEGSGELVALLADAPAVVSIEEAFRVGGLGSLLAGTVARHRLPCRFLDLGVDGPLGSRSGSEAHMRRIWALDRDGMARAVASFLRSEPGRDEPASTRGGGSDHERRR